MVRNHLQILLLILNEFKRVKLTSIPPEISEHQRYVIVALNPDVVMITSMVHGISKRCDTLFHFVDIDQCYPNPCLHESTCIPEGKTSTKCNCSLGWKGEHCERKYCFYFRSSLSQMFLRIGVLKNFVIFLEKNLCWSIFLIKLQPLFNKVLRTGFFTEYFRWLLLLFSGIAQNQWFVFSSRTKLFLLNFNLHEGRRNSTIPLFCDEAKEAI